MEEKINAARWQRKKEMLVIRKHEQKANVRAIHHHLSPGSNRDFLARLAEPEWVVSMSVSTQAPVLNWNQKFSTIKSFWNLVSTPTNSCQDKCASNSKTREICWLSRRHFSRVFLWSPRTIVKPEKMTLKSNEAFGVHDRIDGQAALNDGRWSGSTPLLSQISKANPVKVFAVFDKLLQKAKQLQRLHKTGRASSLRNDTNKQ